MAEGKLTGRQASQVAAVVRWYLEHVYARWEGPGTTAFYCDRSRVGHFAIDPKALAAGSPAALFKLFVTLAMYQARRDTVIMAQQRDMPASDARLLTSATTLSRHCGAAYCRALTVGEFFDSRCSVFKRAGRVDCDEARRRSCHVKDATVALNRTGDMGKLPTSAWLHLWKGGNLARTVAAVCAQEKEPGARAELLVERFASVHRVGRKLATLFVSALSTPALAPGLTPWFPRMDGNQLVVVDTNVARAVDLLRGALAPRTYEARAQWLTAVARGIPLRQYRAELPDFSPRLVQQALYAFCSKSNRTARQDPCAFQPGECDGCAPSVCPFVAAT